MSLPVTPGRRILGIVIILCFSVSVSTSSQPLSLSADAQGQTTSSVPNTSNQNPNDSGSTTTVDIVPQGPGLVQKSDKNPSVPAHDKSDIKVEEILQQIFKAEFEDEGVEMQNDVGIPEVTAVGVNLNSSAAVNNIVPPGSVQDKQRQGRGTEFDGNSREGRRPKRPQQRRNENNRKRQNQKPKFTPGKNANNNGQKNKRRGPNNKNFGGGGKGVKGQENRRALNLAKYNAYMDAVLGRMNALIRKKRMDPLRVNLYAGGGGQGQGGGQGPGAQNKNKRKGQGKTKKKGGARWEEDDDDSGVSDDEDESQSSEVDEEGRSVRDFTLLGSSPFQRKMRAIPGNVTNDEDERAVASGTETKTAESPDDDEGRAKVKQPNRKPNKGQNKRPLITNSDEEDDVSHPPPKKRVTPRPTRGVLHGLSSLRRDGNVQVVKDGDKARIIRSRFLLGPVALEILPKKLKKKSSREDSEVPVSPSPSMTTATAPELKGILEIRLSPGKPTRIRKLRVFPPGNIQVDGDKKSGNQGMKRAGYRKVTPMATARLRQTAVQVLRQVDHKMKNGGRLRGGEVN